MANISIETNSLRTIVVWDPVYQTDTLTLAGADTIAAGTILARDSSSLKLVLFVKGGSTNENGIPKAILNQEIVVTGAGDSAVSPLISGRVRKGDLIIDADGDDTNIDAAVIELAQTTTQLSQLDNQ